MARYDEDIHENAFFQTLIGKYGNLFNEAAEQRCLVSLNKAHQDWLNTMYACMHVTASYNVNSPLCRCLCQDVRLCFA